MHNLLPAKLSKATLAICSRIASLTRFCQRDSQKFDASAFLQTLLASVTSGKASYNQLAASLGNRTKKPMSREAISKRFNGRCVDFLSAVHRDLIGQFWTETTETTSRFNRVIIEDSTTAKLLKSNSETFPGCGNVRGKTAGVKVDFAYNLLTGEIVAHTLEEARRQAISIGEACLANVKPGDLVVRDMGYFSSAQFDDIESIGADWLSRLPLKVQVEMDSGGNGGWHVAGRAATGGETAPRKNARCGGDDGLWKETRCSKKGAAGGDPRG
jgi:hypothetical protein